MYIREQQLGECARIRGGGVCGIYSGSARLPSGKGYGVVAGVWRGSCTCD